VEAKQHDKEQTAEAQHVAGTRYFRRFEYRMLCILQEYMQPRSFG
jgi:hypothetical protein